MQLFILPEVLIVENYVMISRLGLFDTILGVGMPYMASAFGIFLMRQAFKSVPIELHEAARIEGCGWLGILWRVYVPLARPTYLAYALVSVSTHWNRSEEHTSELQSLMRISYAVFCLKKKTN